MKMPFLKFFTNDWLADEALRICSLEARGLWIDLLCLMSKNEKRGYLEQQGEPICAEQIGRMAGISAEKAENLLRELQKSGVFSVTKKGVIYSRRIVRDNQFLQKCSEAGKKGGGNPAFKGTNKGSNKGKPKPSEARSQKPEARSQINTILAADAASDEKLPFAETVPPAKPAEPAKAIPPPTDAPHAPPTPKPKTDRDRIWDAVAATWFGGSVAPPDRSRVGKLVSALVAHGAKPDDVATRLARYRVHWPGAADTPEAVVKHWAMLATEPTRPEVRATGRDPQTEAEQRRRAQAEREFPQEYNLEKLSDWKTRLGIKPGKPKDVRSADAGTSGPKEGNTAGDRPREVLAGVPSTKTASG